MFAGHQAAVQEATIDELVEEEKRLASDELVQILAVRKAIQFSDAVIQLLQSHMLRETNVKDICVGLAKAGRIENTWGKGNRKPSDSTMIKHTQ
jgi:hypothetical protein